MPVAQCFWAIGFTLCEKAFLYIQAEPHLFQSMLVLSCPHIIHHYDEPGFAFSGEKVMMSPAWSQTNVAPGSAFFYCISWLGFMYSKSFIFRCFPTECNILLSGRYYQKVLLLSYIPFLLILFKVSIKSTTMIILINTLLVEWVSNLGQ